MGIRNSEQLVVSDFLTDAQGNPTGGQTVIPFGLINWQNGIIEDGEQNGAFVEDVLEAARQRLQFFNRTRFRCRENSIAITKIEEALQWLDWRTRSRVRQGVENTYDEHVDEVVDA